ncbi:MAG: aminotransferase class I/II-fold pyridoxal phosphate-dependent enzyme, partial [Clostridiales bacterium]
CNPCNPTGQYLSTEFLQELIRNHHRIKFLIDEAYLDFLPQEMPGLDFRNHQNLYILRSLTKTYHLSGLRCGYLLSDEENIKQLSL